jgi:hypothetical protein
MIGIIDEQGSLVGKHRLSFLETHAVLALVGGVLPRIPFEANVVHESLYTYYMYSVKGTKFRQGAA